MTKLRSTIVLAVFMLYTVLEVSVINGLELYVGNDLVFIFHNFPDILQREYDPKDEKRYLFAMLSGLICCWPFLI